MHSLFHFDSKENILLSIQNKEIWPAVTQFLEATPSKAYELFFRRATHELSFLQ